MLGPQGQSRGGLVGGTNVSKEEASWAGHLGLLPEDVKNHGKLFVTCLRRSLGPCHGAGRGAGPGGLLLVGPAAGCLQARTVCVVVSFSEVHKMKQPMVAKEPVLVQNIYQSTNKKVCGILIITGFPGGASGKDLPANETQAQSLGQEDPLEEVMAIHSSILTWRI